MLITYNLYNLSSGPKDPKDPKDPKPQRRQVGVEHLGWIPRPGSTIEERMIGRVRLPCTES